MPYSICVLSLFYSVRGVCVAGIPFLWLTISFFEVEKLVNRPAAFGVISTYVFDKGEGGFRDRHSNLRDSLAGVMRYDLLRFLG